VANSLLLVRPTEYSTVICGDGSGVSILQRSARRKAAARPPHSKRVAARRQEKSGSAESRVEKKRKKRKRKSTGIKPLLHEEWNAGKKAQKRLLLHGVAVGVDFVDFADVEFADAGFDFAHVADDDPHEMAGLDIFFGDFVGGVWSGGQDFLGKGVVLVVRQAVLQDVAVRA
jgi:hypothetical protein